MGEEGRGQDEATEGIGVDLEHWKNFSQNKKESDRSAWNLGVTWQAETGLLGLLRKGKRHLG